MRLGAHCACIATLTIMSVPASGQTVMLADLDGAVVEASVSYQNNGVWKGQPIETQSRNGWTIALGPGNAGRIHSTTTIRSPRGTRTTQTGSSPFTLGQPKETTNLGEGHRLWVFDNGVLTMLRTFRAGGFRISIAFARTAGGLTCTIRAVHAREVGAGNIRRESFFGGSYEIISSTPTGSTCKVRKA